MSNDTHNRKEGNRARDIRASNQDRKSVCRAGDGRGRDRAGLVTLLSISSSAGLSLYSAEEGCAEPPSCDVFSDNWSSGASIISPASPRDPSTLPQEGISHTSEDI